MKPVVAFALAASLLFTASCAKKIKVGPEDARTIAREAYIYGLPIVENYKVMYAYAVYKGSGAYKAPFNALAIITPDTAQVDSIQRAAPEPKTPYAISWLDLRQEPVVITVPPFDATREVHVQLVDMYTFNFAELGTRATGHAGGKYMIVPGRLAGSTPEGITKVIACETSFALAIFRVKPLGTDSNATIGQLLYGFSVESESVFEGRPPKRGEALIFPPYSQETAMSPGFFQYLNFALQFCPVHPSEIHERARFAKLAIDAGETFNLATMDREILAAVNGGIADAKAVISEEAARTPPGAAKYGTRAQLQNNFLARAVAAKERLYGPSQVK